MRILNLQVAISEAKRLAEQKIAVGEGADEFVEIAEADGFEIYIAA